MATIDMSILYQDYIKNCKSSNIVPLNMIKWYNKFYEHRNSINHKRYNAVEEVIDEINKIRLNHLYVI